jgi:hypothetical protein
MFKGSGFYKTDYRSDTYKKHAEADKPSGKSTEGKSDKSEKSASKTESSTEAKPEKKHAAKDKK